MATHPYLHFDGASAEAPAFYADALGGPDLQHMRCRDAPGLPETMRADRVIHGQLTIGGGTLMASDAPESQGGAPQASVSVMQSAPDVTTARAWFDTLAEGGTAAVPFGPAFFAPAFGMVKDRFGTHWMITAVSGA